MSVDADDPGPGDEAAGSWLAAGRSVAAKPGKVSASKADATTNAPKSPEQKKAALAASARKGGVAPQKGSDGQEIIGEDVGHGRVKGGKRARTGVLSRMAAQNINRAATSGLLPHEILLSIARGEQQDVHHWNPDAEPTDPARKARGERGAFVRSITYPDLAMRMSAAKDAAPYYAPKLAMMEMFNAASDDELDAAIVRLAAEAGIDLADAGEGEEAEAE